MRVCSKYSTMSFHTDDMNALVSHKICSYLVKLAFSAACFLETSCLFYFNLRIFCSFDGLRTPTTPVMFAKHFAPFLVVFLASLICTLLNVNCQRL